MTDDLRSLLKEAVKIIHAGQRNLNKDWLIRARKALRDPGKSNTYEPALNLACEEFEPDPSSRFCGKCGYSRADHSAPRTKATP